MNIIVVGDVMLDINKYCNITRKAPEADIPIYNILDVNYILGGSANVATNLTNLKTNVELISVIGDDVHGNTLLELVHSKNITKKFFVDKGRHTSQKNRIFHNNELVVRYDVETTDDISFDLETQICEYILNKQNIDAIILSDYNKGVITNSLSQTIITYANQQQIPTFVDPKTKDYMKYKNCFLFKPNQIEAEIISQEKNIHKILENITHKINCKNILLTRGKEGMVLNNIYNKIEHNDIINLVDVTGAGDIVLAVVVYIFLKGGDLLSACKIANYIGGKSVGVIGNYNVTLNDITEYYENTFIEKGKIIYDYETEKITQLSNTQNIAFTNGCFDILHSAHIQLFKFAKKHGNILVVGLNSDDSIKRLKGVSRPINDINERSTILSLFDFIDYIIIFNDDTPLNVIRTLKPAILVKGSDYTIDNIIGKEYVEKVMFFDFIKNKSSTNVINKIRNS